jgi:hypothetical protein
MSKAVSTVTRLTASATDTASRFERLFAETMIDKDIAEFPRFSLQEAAVELEVSKVLKRVQEGLYKKFRGASAGDRLRCSLCGRNRFF